MPRTDTTQEDRLSHVVVCGGTPEEWSRMSTADWASRFAAIAAGVSLVGAKWVTLFPHHGPAVQGSGLSDAIGAAPGVSRVGSSATERWLWRRDDCLAVVVDTSPDGHERFAAVVDAMRVRGESIDEDRLSAALSAPVDDDADLVLILGPPDVLPTSLVWELAYSELVFLDIPWDALQPVHLEMAIDDFNRRHRRFGGLDS